MRAHRLTITLLASLLAHAPGAARAEDPTTPAPPASRRLVLKATPWTGDFDGMLERRRIRVLVPYSRTLYFNDHGQERGVTADHVRGFERWLNARHAKQLRNRPLTVVIIPTTRDRLLADVAAGLGDVAAANLTATPARLQVVDLVVNADLPEVKEVVVTGARTPAIGAADGLSGRTVHVRRASSYHESLQALGARLASEGKPPVNVVLVPDALEDEDLMEMVDAGIVEAVVVDDWKARMWAQVLPGIRVNGEAVLRSGGQVGWAIRKGSPRLSDEIRAYMKAEGKRGMVVGRVKQYARRLKRLKDPTEAKERKRFEQLVALFEKYGQRYRFDPLLLAAQGYQESRLNQAARSHRGAVGVMQLMPATGRELDVGDIHQAEPNIHAGTKFMDRLMTRYFADAEFDDLNRTLFAFASYNAGPGTVARLRREAEKGGFDPDQWFNHVEVVAARRIGLETTTYVRNIYKYYVAYRLMEEARAAAGSAREGWTSQPAR